MLIKNQLAPTINTNSVSDQQIDLSRLRGKKVLIKFHRFSGCPVAQNQIHELIERQNELNAVGIETIVFMHSSKRNIQSNFKETSGLHIIADRQKTYYRLYHSQFLLKKLFSMASWRVTFSSIFKGNFPHFNKFGGGIIGIPSDFLLDKDGMIADLHYGQHFGDSWTVSEVISKGSKVGN
jgi:thioredoxin-dependent peroxiredoxin